MGRSLRLNGIQTPENAEHAGTVAAFGDENEDSVVERQSKRRSGQAKGLHAILSNYTERVFSLPTPSPQSSAVKSQRSTLGFKPSSQSVSPGWTNLWLSQKRPRPAKTRNSTVHGYLSHTHTLDARPHICTPY